MPDERRAAPASSEKLEGLAEISTSDIDAAVRRWNQDARTQFRGLLDAAPLTGSERIDERLARAPVIRR